MYLTTGRNATEWVCKGERTVKAMPVSLVELSCVLVLLLRLLCLFICARLFAPKYGCIIFLASLTCMANNWWFSVSYDKSSILCHTLA